MRLCVQFGVVGVVKRDELEAILSELRPRQWRRRRRTTKAEQQSEQAKERTVHDSMTCKRRGGKGRSYLSICTHCSAGFALHQRTWSCSRHTPCPHLSLLPPPLALWLIDFNISAFFP